MAAVLSSPMFFGRSIGSAGLKYPLDIGGVRVVRAGAATFDLEAGMEGVAVAVVRNVMTSFFGEEDQCMPNTDAGADDAYPLVVSACSPSSWRRAFGPFCDSTLPP